MARRRRWWPAAKTWRARLAALSIVPMPVRKRILQTLGHRFGPGARMWPGVLVLGSHLTLGRDTFVNGGCFGPPDRRASTLTLAPVRVGDGAWLGAGAIVLPGATLGAGCIVGAGAVVDGEVAPNALYGGVPARLIRTLE